MFLIRLLYNIFFACRHEFQIDSGSSKRAKVNNRILDPEIMVRSTWKLLQVMLFDKQHMYLIFL